MFDDELINDEIENADGFKANSFSNRTRIVGPHSSCKFQDPGPDWHGAVIECASCIYFKVNTMSRSGLGECTRN